MVEQNTIPETSRRLSIVMDYLYPDLNKHVHQSGLVDNTLFPPDKDYICRNDLDGTGTYLIWQNKEIPEPTAQQIADAKEPALNAAWWKDLRWKRDRLLGESDWTQTPDIPSSIKDAWRTYRQELRDLPTTVIKPEFAVLTTQRIKDWNIHLLMPTKPGG